MNFRNGKSMNYYILNLGIPPVLICASLLLMSCSAQKAESGKSPKNDLATTEESADIGTSADQKEQLSTMTDKKKTSSSDTESPKHITRTDEEWREILTPEQYSVMRECGTERAFTGEYWNTKTSGVYLCAGCGQELFNSEEKYNSGSGWPSFWKADDEANVAEIKDQSLGMVRTEVTCGRCNAHLGHLFEDGPQPTGMRYCVNSAALKLKPSDETDKTADGSDSSDDGGDKKN